MNREYAVAAFSSSENKYAKTGTDKMEPPPPNKPRVIPINKAIT